jgi:hypothetical protein
METTNKVKADFSKFMQPPITTMEEFNRVLYSDVGEDGDYWDETLSNDWDDDLARPDDFPITCVISDDGKNLHYMFQVTNKALNASRSEVYQLDNDWKDNSVNEAVLTISEDKDDSTTIEGPAVICFDFDHFMDRVNR